MFHKPESTLNIHQNHGSAKPLTAQEPPPKQDLPCPLLWLCVPGNLEGSEITAAKSAECWQGRGGASQLGPLGPTAGFRSELQNVPLIVSRPQQEIETHKVMLHNGRLFLVHVTFQRNSKLESQKQEVLFHSHSYSETKVGDP